MIGSLFTGENVGFSIYVFILTAGSAFFPSLLAVFIFYLLVRGHDRHEATALRQFYTFLLFGGMCVLAIILWCIGESLFTGDTTIEEFSHRFREFWPWTILVIPAAATETLFYYGGFLSSLENKKEIDTNGKE